jgi:hypothetical protein
MFDAMKYVNAFVFSEDKFADKVAFMRSSIGIKHIRFSLPMVTHGNSETTVQTESGEHVPVIEINDTLNAVIACEMPDNDWWTTGQFIADLVPTMHMVNAYHEACENVVKRRRGNDGTILEHAVSAAKAALQDAWTRTLEGHTRFFMQHRPGVLASQEEADAVIALAKTCDEVWKRPLMV